MSLLQTKGLKTYVRSGYWMLLNFSEGDYALHLARKTGYAYSHSSKTIIFLKNKNIFTVKKDRNRLRLYLTPKGKRIQHHIRKIYMLEVEEK